MSTLDSELLALLDHTRHDSGPIVVLTGAGISAESGIPTFRGKEGYWVIGSREYHPQELATWRTFQAHPERVWPWYLYRRTVCRRSQPNAGHLALARLEMALKDRFVLVTQNVDGLHLRAGNSLERTWQIHGNIDYVRCSAECGAPMRPVPETIPPYDRGDTLQSEHVDALRCPECGAMGRPHVLWFDEYYDEDRYRFDSAQHVTARASMLLVIGTSGATNLPLHMASIAARRGIPIVDINLSPDNPFAEAAKKLDNGFALTGASGDFLPAIADYLAA
jgi:NAD-dependent deacetylase